MEVNKISELEKGKLYWITVRDANPEMIINTAELAEAAGIKSIVSTDQIKFPEIPKGLKLKKLGNGFIVE